MEHHRFVIARHSLFLSSLSFLSFLSHLLLSHSLQFPFQFLFLSVYFPSHCVASLFLHPFFVLFPPLLAPLSFSFLLSFSFFLLCFFLFLHPFSLLLISFFSIFHTFPISRFFVSYLPVLRSLFSSVSLLFLSSLPSSVFPSHPLFRS